MAFLEKVEETHGLKECLKTGLQALTQQYRRKIRARDSRKINGSIFLEECVNGRWDYIIGYNDKTFFVEIHPVKTSEVENVLDKLFWLRRWKENTPFKDDSNFFWLSTNGVGILKRSSYWKKVHKQGLRIKRTLNLE
ncbi:hypothetical protein [Palaeococcus sp. (in: euryarchaeotes)]